MKGAVAVLMLVLAAALPAAAADPSSVEEMPRPVKLAESHEIYDALLTADGKHLVTSSRQHYEQYPKLGGFHPGVTLWDLDGGKVLRRGKLEAPSDEYERGMGPRVLRLGLSADGKTLLAYLETRYLELLSFPELKSLAVVDVKKSARHWYRSSAFSPDGAYLALGDNDGEIALWSVADRALVKTWKAHDKTAEALAFAPDGKTLATGGEDEAVRLWALPAAKKLREIDDLEGAVMALRFSPDAATLAIGARFKGSGAKVRLWSVARKRFLSEQQCGVLFPAIRLAFSADSRRLAQVCSIGIGGDFMSLLRIFAVENGAMLAEINRKTQTNAVLFMPDGRRLITAQKQEVHSSLGDAYNQSIAVWGLEPVQFLNYFHDPQAKP